jgi:hypothetical protein
MIDREILFKYEQQSGRVVADCGDVYNWLLDQHPETAGAFKKKYREAEKDMKEDYQRRHPL